MERVREIDLVSVKSREKLWTAERWMGGCRRLAIVIFIMHDFLHARETRRSRRTANLY